MLDVLHEYLQRRQSERQAGDGDPKDDPQRQGQQKPFETHRLAEQRQHDQHAEVADKLQRERGSDGSINHDFVWKGDLADQSGVTGKTDRSALQALLRGEPGPQRDRDEDQEALPVHCSRAKHGREDKMVYGKQRKRV